MTVLMTVLSEYSKTVIMSGTVRVWVRCLASRIIYWKGRFYSRMKPFVLTLLINATWDGNILGKGF